MGASLKKNLAVTLYCHYRQAERSVHFALSNPAQWLGFIRYYDPMKRKALASALEALRAVGTTDRGIPTREQFLRTCFFRPWTFLLNQLRESATASWRFSEDELAFLCATLAAFDSVLDSHVAREHAVLIDLRLDLCTCEAIIENRLIGVAELRTARNIEHFGQSDYVRHVTFEEIGTGLEPKGGCNGVS